MAVFSLPKLDAEARERAHFLIELFRTLRVPPDDTTARALIAIGEDIPRMRAQIIAADEQITTTQVH